MPWPSDRQSTVTGSPPRTMLSEGCVAAASDSRGRHTNLGVVLSLAGQGAPVWVSFNGSQLQRHLWERTRGTDGFADLGWACPPAG